MTSPFTFNAPGGAGGYLKPADLLGHPLLITKVSELDIHFDQLKNNGQGGDVERVRFDYVDLSDPAGAGAPLQSDVYNTHAGIVIRLKQYAGHPVANVLARVSKVASKTQGRSDAFILEDCSSDPGVVAAATAWVQAETARTFQAPAAAPSPAAAPPVAPVAAVAPAGMQPADQLAAYAQPAAAPAGAPWSAQPAAPVPNPEATYLANTPVGQPAAEARAALPVIPGVAPAQVEAMLAAGLDVNAIAAVAGQLGAQPVQQ